MDEEQGLRSRRAAARDWVETRLLGGEMQIVLVLAAAALLVALFATLAIRLLEIRHGRTIESNGEAFWNSLIRTMDPGQITEDRGAFAVVGLITTIIGLLLVSTLISLVNNSVQVWTDRAKRGRQPARVHRQRGTTVPYYVVLGWTGLTTKILEELAASTLGRPPEVLVLSDESVEWMREKCNEARDDMGVRLPKRWPQLRTGRVTHTGDLHHIARIEHADAVIVLAPDPAEQRVLTAEGPGDTICESSAKVIRTVFAVTAALDDAGGPQALHGFSDADRRKSRIVVELPENARDSDRLKKRLEHRFASEQRHGVELIAVAGDSIQSRLAAQVTRRAGLNSVYREILDFDDCEIRIAKNLPGFSTFGEAVALAANATVMGIARPNAGSDGAGEPRPANHAWSAELWPHWSTPTDGCDLVVLKDDEQPLTSTMGSVPPALTGERVVPQRDTDPESVLVIGWNHRAAGLLRSLDSYLPRGSAIHVRAADVTEASTLDLPRTGRPEVLICEDGVQGWLDSTHGAREYGHSVVLADDTLSAAVSDANVLMTLLALHPAGNVNMNPETVVAELRKRSSRHLVSERLAHDLIVGDSLLALVLAQFAVESRVQAVLEDLLTEGTVELDLVHFEGTPPTTFADVVLWCAERGTTALGYTTTPVDDHVVGPLFMDPKKNSRIRGDIDKVVVMTRSAAALDPMDA